MSNIEKLKRPIVTIELDGTEYTLKYTLGAFAKMEEQYGSVDKALKAMEDGSIKAVIFLLYVGLNSTNKTVTEEFVGDAIDILDMEEVAAKMNSVMAADLPDKTKSVKVEKQNPNE